VITQCQDRLVQLQCSHTPSNTPFSHILTTSWSTTQPVSIPCMHLARTFHTLYNNLFTTQQTIKASRRTNLSRHPFPLPNTNICHHIHTILFCVTQPASIPSHTTPPPCPPRYPLSKTSLKCSKNRNHNAGTRHNSPIPISLTNTYSLTLGNPTSVDLLTYIPHSQYIQPHSRVPTGVDLPIYASHSQYIPPYSPRPNQR